MHVRRVDAEEDAGPVDPGDAISAPLVRVREAMAAPPQGVALGGEDGQAHASRRVAKAVHLELRSGGGGIDHSGFFPTTGTHLPYRSVFHEEETGVASHDVADGRLPPCGLLHVGLGEVLGDARGCHLLQGAHIKITGHDVPRKRLHLGDELLPCHLSIADASEQALRLHFVRPNLRLLRPMQVPPHERLEEIDLLNARFVRLQYLHEIVYSKVQEAICLHHPLCVLEDEAHVPIVDAVLLVRPCES
mmetsp:Transcript_59909/g.131477  ORF Transcript_59909/g.131477 Transcript_59909/m.131477 type:complete len:247 (+) Transcript_59909:255-995(+)